MKSRFGEIASDPSLADNESEDNIAAHTPHEPAAAIDEENIEKLSQPGPENSDPYSVTSPFSDDAKKTLVRLIQGPGIDKKRHPQHWRILLNCEPSFRLLLDNLFLELVIDEDLGIGFIRQNKTHQEEDIPKLIRNVRLTFLDSVLLIFLRKLLNENQALGKRSVVTLDEMLNHLRMYEQSDNADKAGFQKRVYAVVEKAKKHGFLQRISHSQNRYEISPMLSLLFGIDEIKRLGQQFDNLRIDAAKA